MDEAKLQEIEAKSLRAVPKCNVCNVPARWTTGAYRMTEDFCEACMPKSRFPLSRIQFAELDSLDLVAEVRRLNAALATARREGAEGARRIPLKIYLVEGNVIAARSGREASTIADDQCGDSGPVIGPLKGDRTVPMRTTTGEAVQIEVAKLLASGVQRGVVTRAIPLDAPGGAT